MTSDSIYQIQVKNSSAAMEHRIQVARTSLIQSTSDPQLGGHLLIHGTSHKRSDDSSLNMAEKSSDESPEAEIEEPGDESEQEANNREDEDTENGLMVDDLDDDSSFDTALMLCDDLRSLDNKILRLTKNVIKPVAPHDVAPPEPQSAMDSNPATARSEEQSNFEVAESSVILIEDLLGEKYEVSFEECKTFKIIGRHRFFPQIC